MATKIYYSDSWNVRKCRFDFQCVKKNFLIELSRAIGHNNNESNYSLGVMNVFQLSI